MPGILDAAVALKVELVAPAGTTIDAGTVNDALLLDSEMAIPPAGAAVFRVAEHVEIWPPLRLTGIHVIEESKGTTMVPPVAVSWASPEPAPETSTGLERTTGVDVALAACVSWKLATTPEVNAVVFGPPSRQRSEPGAEKQERDFPAAAAAGPAVALTAEIWVVGY